MNAPQNNLSQNNNDPDWRTALLHLLEGWEAQKREAHERYRHERASNVQTAYFFQGVTETYARAIADVRDLLASGDDHAQPMPAEPVTYLPMGIEEVEHLLNSAGVYSRQITLHPDNAITAVFARLQPVPQDERLRRLQEADERIVILDSGKLPDTGEPYIDFGFKDE